MHACDMTVTYLRAGLSPCDVLWLPVKYFFLTFMKFLVQLCENFFYTFLSRSHLRFRTSVF